MDYKNFNLKDFLNKIIGQPTQAQRTEHEQAVARQQAKLTKRSLEEQAKKLELVAKINMLDGALSAKIIDTLIPSERDKISKEENNMLKSVASEQEEFNYQYITDTKAMSAPDRIDLFSKSNSIFLSASQTFEYYNAYNRAWPQTHLSEDNTIKVKGTLEKFNRLLAGKSKEERVKNLVDITGCDQSAAIDFQHSLDKRHYSGIDEYNERYGRDVRLYNFVVNSADHNFNEYSKTHQSNKQQTATNQL